MGHPPRSSLLIGGGSYPFDELRSKKIRTAPARYSTALAPEMLLTIVNLALCHTIFNKNRFYLVWCVS